LIFPEKKDSTLHTVKKHQKGPDSCHEAQNIE